MLKGSRNLLCEWVNDFFLATTLIVCLVLDVVIIWVATRAITDTERSGCDSHRYMCNSYRRITFHSWDHLHGLMYISGEIFTLPSTRSSITREPTPRPCAHLHQQVTNNYITIPPLTSSQCQRMFKRQQPKFGVITKSGNATKWSMNQAMPDALPLWAWTSTPVHTADSVAGRTPLLFLRTTKCWVALLTLRLMEQRNGTITSKWTAFIIEPVQAW